jgi:magnesium-transporting ATPase (P-type)
VTFLSDGPRDAAEISRTKSDSPSLALSEGTAAHGTAGYWAALSVNDVLSALVTGADGLSAEEAGRRLTRYGPNVLPRPARRGQVREFIGNFIHLFALLLWAGAALAWLAGTPELAIAIVGVIILNGLFSFWQEYQAERAVEALEAMLPQNVTVRRGGLERSVPVSEIVPGDLLVLTEGEAVPSDARVIVAEQLRIDASSLTGESRPMPRFADPVAVGGRLDVALENLVFAGTTVVGGRAEAVAFATGAATEFGRIARLTHVQVERPSPLQRELIRITRVITFIAVAMAASFYTLGVALAGMPPASGFVFAVGIIVANVPEGLLPTLTLSLAFAVRRMAARNAIVRRLAAVETLGAASVILTDKTGTLTENEMTVREVWTLAGHFRLTGSGYDPTGAIEWVGAQQERSAGSFVQTVKIAALCCDAHLLPPDAAGGRWKAVGDPTEAAIVVSARKLGMTEATLRACPRLTELPFDPARKRMTIVHRIGADTVACVKGALGQLLPRCTSCQSGNESHALNARISDQITAAHDELASRGMRVLAVASRTLDLPDHALAGCRSEEVEQDLTFLGLIAMEDPPRPEVPAAIAACREAGIRPVMVTGDDGLTASAIARQVGMCRSAPCVVTGPELDRMGDVELDRRISDPELLFARVAPEHKLRLVAAFQRTGAVVAVTGDGVNDAPALKLADIGVAMGATGSDVAREAADMVLVDDNFASIVAAIREGRGVYDNVRKFLTYVLTSNVPEAAAFIAFAIFRVPLPLTVMQVLAIDLGTDILPALALGIEPPEQDVMRRPPRSRGERLLDRVTMARVYGWLGPLEAVLALGGYFLVLRSGGWIPGEMLGAGSPLYREVTTTMFIGIVACQVGAVFACRTRHDSTFALPLTANRVLLVGIASEIALAAAVATQPGLGSTLGFASPPSHAWLAIATFAPAVVFAEEARKAMTRRLTRRPLPVTRS